jgi:hypothetical protein
VSFFPILGLIYNVPFFLARNDPTAQYSGYLKHGNPSGCESGAGPVRTGGCSFDGGRRVPLFSWVPYLGSLNIVSSRYFTAKIKEYLSYQNGHFTSIRTPEEGRRRWLGRLHQIPKLELDPQLPPHSHAPSRPLNGHKHYAPSHWRILYTHHRAAWACAYSALAHANHCSRLGHGEWTETNTDYCIRSRYLSTVDCANNSVKNKGE